MTASFVAPEVISHSEVHVAAEPTTINLWSLDNQTYLNAGRVVQLRVQGKAVKGLPNVTSFRVDPVFYKPLQDANHNQTVTMDVGDKCNYRFYVESSTDKLCNFKQQDERGVMIRDFIVSTFHLLTTEPHVVMIARANC